MQMNDNAPTATPAGYTEELRTRFIHSRLREAILHGELDGRQPLSQVQLAKRLGVSRTPLREALRMLQREGLIESEPNRMVRVTALSVTDLEQLYATRIALEALALRLSVPHFVDEDVVEMADYMAQMDEVAGEQDFDRWEAPHRAYHDLLRKYAGVRLIRSTQELSEHAEHYRRVYLAQPATWALAAQEHRAIFDACVARQPIQASEKLARHLARTALTVIASVAPEHDPIQIRTALQMVLPR